MTNIVIAIIKAKCSIKVISKLSTLIMLLKIQKKDHNNKKKNI